MLNFIKFSLVLFLSLLSFGQQVHAQHAASAKIYLGLLNSSISLRTTVNPNFELDISSRNQVGYTLIETDQDSLGLILANGQVAFLHCELGKSYHYVLQKGDNFGFRELSANAFWLSMATQDVKRYKHYVITRQAGIVRASDSTN